MASTTITLYRGEYIVKRFTLTQNGTAVDITDAAVSFVVRSAYPAGTTAVDTDALINKTVGSGITLTDPTNGIFDVTFNSADTKSIEFSAGASHLDYVYGCEITLSGDPGARPVAHGKFTLLPDVVRVM